MQQNSTLLPQDWNIPDRLRDRLGATAGRQRLLIEDGHLLLVLHAPPGADEIGRRGRYFWRHPEGTWRVAPAAERVANLDEHLREYSKEIEKLEQSEDEARQARDYFGLLDRLAPLARSIRHMHDALQEARDAAGDDRRLIVARDQAYDLNRRAELLHDDLKNGLDYAVARQAEQQAETTYQMSVAAYRLNVLAAFFFPIATLMAVFGSNLRHGFEEWDQMNRPYMLLSVLAAGLLVGMILTIFITRPIKREPGNNQSKSSNSRTKRSK
jgi:hypothetical protein